MSSRNDILNAARNEFLERGFDATRMRSIAERAGTNKGLLHYYFKSKESLLVEVFQDSFQSLFEQLIAVFKSESRFEKKIERAVELYMDFMVQNPKLPWFVINEVNRHPDLHKKRMEEAGVRPPFHEMIASIEAAKKSGEVRKDLDSQQFIVSMISLILFPIIGKPMLQMVHNMDEKRFSKLIVQRKKHITKTLQLLAEQP